MEATDVRHTCLKLQIEDAAIFIKGNWHPARFDLFITDGVDAWICNATEKEVEQRAELWDQPISEYISLAKKHLGAQQPGSIYRFEDAGMGKKRLSWTFEREKTRLEWRWKCKSSANSKQTTSSILEFLLDSNSRITEEIASTRQSFEKMKVETEKCLAQSERYCTEKKEFEDAVYSKFVEVLNSKKAKLRQLRDQLSRYESTGTASQVKHESDDDAETDGMSTEDEEV